MVFTGRYCLVIYSVELGLTLVNFFFVFKSGLERSSLDLYEGIDHMSDTNYMRSKKS